MEALTLYVDAFWISPYALSAFVALEEKGLPFAVEEVALDRKEQRRSDYGAHTGRVPALRHGDYWLAESSAICEYLAETFPFPGYPRLFPENLRERGICREVQAWVRSEMMPLRDERPTQTLWYESIRATPLSPAGREAAERLVRIAERWIGEGRTTLFNAWCIADTDLGVMLQRLHHNGDPLPEKLRVYAEAQWERASVRKWTERARRPYVAY